MTDYNIFLCYRDTNSGLLASNIYHELDRLNNPNLKIFYAPKCIPYGKDFVEICKNTANSVSLMILIITNNFFENILDENDIVGIELRSALSNPECKFLPILFSDVDIKKLNLEKFFSQQDKNRITHINPIRYTDIYSFESTILFAPIFEHFAIDIKNNANKNIDISKQRTHIAEKNKGGFFSDTNTTEKNRLSQQQQLLLKYDMPIYEKLLKNKSNINVLDLGCGNGTALMNRFGHRAEVNKIIGIEYDPINVAHATELYKDQNAFFYQGDVESEDFPNLLEQIMDTHNIASFDFINILALISHLKNPSKLFKVIRKFCSNDAHIFIRNIDDGFNVAFPDEKGHFETALSILQRCVSTGYRFSGRQLFTYLKKWGYQNITLEKTGINTTEMTQLEKEALFDVVFKFISNGITNDLMLNPNSEELQKIYNWYMSNIDSIEEAFMSPDFFLNFGFLIFTANLN